MALTMTASHLTPTLPHGERLTHKGFHYDSPTANCGKTHSPKAHPDSGHGKKDTHKAFHYDSPTSPLGMTHTRPFTMTVKGLV